MSSSFAQARRDFSSIPIVDLKGIDTDLGLTRIAAALTDASINAGFFYIKNHGIDPALIDRAFAASKAFFEQPAEVKSTIAVDQNQRGWMAQGLATLEGSKTHDAKEVFFWGWDIDEDSADLKAGLPLVALNQWPDPKHSSLKNDLLPYYKAVVSLSQKILRALAQGLGQQQAFFETAYKNPLARGQLVYYPPSTTKDEQEQRFGAAEHSDFGVLTILLQDQSGGLQVKNLSDEWIEAPPIDGTFVCNIGDLMERWTNKRLVSTKHRVINRSGKPRYSIPIFCDPNSAAIVDPSDFTLDDDPALFEPISAGAYIAGKNKKNFGHLKDKT